MPFGWVLHAAGKKICAKGARALAALLERNTTLKMLNLNCARLCARWRGFGWRSRFLSLVGRVAPPLVGVTLAVWVGCCARRREWHRRRRRESSGGLTQEEHDAQDALPRRCAALCSRWLGKGGCVARSHGPAARGRTMQSELARAAGRRACGVGSPCRARCSSFLSA